MVRITMKIIGSDDSNRDQMIDDSDNNHSTENDNDEIRIHSRHRWQVRREVNECEDQVECSLGWLHVDLIKKVEDDILKKMCSLSLENELPSRLPKLNFNNLDILNSERSDGGSCGNGSSGKSVHLLVGLNSELTTISEKM